MTSDIKIQLKQAKKLYDSHKYEESFELYEQLFKENPKQFTKWDLISYSWAIYQVQVKNFKDINELFEACEFITDLIPQADLNYSNTCPYTFSVIKVLDLLYNEREFYNLSYWLDKLNPKLLDEKRNSYKGRFSKSRREKYYDYASKSNLECADWEECIEVSKDALKSLKKFTNNSDTWYRWRIAKSLRQLDQNSEAIEYLNKVVEVKKDWFVFREFAENYHALNEDEKAMGYIGNAVLTNDSIDKKVNLFHLAYEILDDINPDMAFRHAELYYLLKLESNAQISEDIGDLDIDESKLNKKQLVNEIKNYWQESQFENQELQYGTIIKFFEDKNYGFIENNDDVSIFFHKSEFEGNGIYVGQSVSFYTEKSFDKSKNKESLKAVCIRGE